jgi:hypothetical protein
VPIEPGALLTFDYTGFRGLSSRRVRQQYLRMGYLFECGCAACIRPDSRRQLPCPRCCPRDAHTGLLLPQIASASGVVSQSLDALWHCSGCAGGFQDAELDVTMIKNGAITALKLPSPSSLFEWERRLEDAAFGFSYQLDEPPGTPAHNQALAIVEE